MECYKLMIKAHIGIKKSMLEKPDLKDENIIQCLSDEYGLNVERITCLPRGADLNTAVYRAVTNDNTDYFVKLRRGEFYEASVTVPVYLSELSVKQVIPAVRTQTRQLWANLNPFKVIVYPFVERHDGYQRKLPQQQWVQFGQALKRFHSADIPATIKGEIQRENFSPRWRDTVNLFLARIKEETYDEPVTAELAAF